MAVDYFKSHLTFAEANLYVKGLRERAKVGYEQTRLLIECICKMLTGNESGLRLPWDKEEQVDDVTDEDILRVQELIRTANEEHKV